MDTLTSKTLVQSHRQCARRAWLEAHPTVQPEYTVTGLSMLEQGKRVHAAARALRPAAVAIPTHLTLAEAAQVTRDALASGATTLIEATFVADGLGVRVDVLESDAHGLHIIEVKSGGDVHEDYLDDAAIQVACLKRAGHRVASVSIEHPSTARTLAHDAPAGSVLTRELVTDTVATRALRVPTWVRECAATLAGPEPRTAPGEQCAEPNPCPFAGHCGKVEKPKDPDRVAVLPSKAGKVRECVAAGIQRVSELPHGAFTHERNKLVREAIMRGAAVVREDFARRVESLPYPRAFVDFETAAPALPLHPGMRPFQPLTFQWSCHLEEATGAVPTHTEFLDASGADPRRAFVVSLLESIGDAATVLVYSSFELHRLAELAAELPDLRERIAAVCERVVDLLPLARRGYYHPAQCGSWSLKAILPTVPNAQALGLAYDAASGVADGLEAQAAYLNLIDPGFTGPKDAIRAKLLAYCGIDTAGLMHFARYVQSHADMRKAA